MPKSLPIFLVLASFLLIAGTIDLNNLDSYANDDDIPAYVSKDLSPDFNPITDEGATLGRVLFYDKQLSANQTTSCATCHLQEFAFSDTAKVSLGLHGEKTARHSMRLVNVRHGVETRVFWNKRTSTLERQTTQPIRDAVEMGFSGVAGAPRFDSLLRRMRGIDYYAPLFNLAFGDPVITERRMQLALAQFIRSIRSFDSKYDIGLAQVAHAGQEFPNFTEEENKGKNIFSGAPNGGIGGIGAGCQSCHHPPEFNLTPDTQNNGIIESANNPNQREFNNTHAPSLRDLVNPQGLSNGPFMHNGSLPTLLDVINHYNRIEFQPDTNPGLDRRFRQTTAGQDLQMTEENKAALIAFLKTLTGSDIYTNPKWSDPFDVNGDIELLGVMTANYEIPDALAWNIYPNPAHSFTQVEIENGEYQLSIFNGQQHLVKVLTISNKERIYLEDLPKGIYYFSVQDLKTNKKSVKKVVKL